MAAKGAYEKFDWVWAFAKLDGAEAAYEQAKAEHPELDWRTTASGGPAMRSAIRKMKKACEGKSAAQFEGGIADLVATGLVGG
jgi:hypothetical protein